MFLSADYHTHTVYSHGKGTVLENAESAKIKNLKEIGITDHGFAHFGFGLKKKDLKTLRSECESAEKIMGIKVLMGVESNLIGVNGEVDLKPENYDLFDLFLAGIHKYSLFKGNSLFNLYFPDLFLGKNKKLFISKRLIKNNTRAFVNAVKNNPIDVITHLNYGCFADPVEVAKVCADYGTYLELNSKKSHLTEDELSGILSTDVKFVIDSDAHTPDRVGEISLVENLMEKIEIPKDRIMNIDGKLPDFRFKHFKEKSL